MSSNFPTTRWSLVFHADRAGAEESLATLCELYWRPVYALIRRYGRNAEEAADLTQAFFTRVLEREYFQAATPARGRFRSFLSASVKHFLLNERDAALTVKRGGRYTFVPLEVDSAEGWYQIEPREDLTPDRLYDRRWARLVLERVMDRTREHYTRTGRIAMFEELKDMLTGSEDRSYVDLGKAVGLSEGAARVTVHRMRQRFRRLLIEEIAATVASPDDVEGELRHLLASLSH